MNKAQLEQVTKALRIVEQAFVSVKRELHLGVTEIQIARWLKKYFKDAGYPRLAFPSIVAFGTNAAVPHHVPTARPLRSGVTVKIDCGVRVASACTDVTRTFWFGKPNALFRRRYRAVLEAQRLAIAAVRPCVLGSTVDQVARGYLREQGIGNYFIHGTGHGIGFRIHQKPYLSPKRGSGRLQSGQLVTVEPGVYFPAWGGIRVEDMVLVTDRGRQILSPNIQKMPNKIEISPH
ncbi:MAG: M24 family metallopeptidase [Candidatus Kerfeldbacteria bacterium]|nr:M24 family metallopeptidase [Candidatus Kerfeldbacteria bacterium]